MAFVKEQGRTLREEGLVGQVGEDDEQEAPDAPVRAEVEGELDSAESEAPPLLPARCWAACLGQTAAMQRLQAIAQLGFVAWVWPRATHTRYAHSLGCYHLARRVVAHLHATCSAQAAACLTPEQVRVFLAAALLHDVGHYPFSHSLDGLGALLPTHERVGRLLIEHSELATVLERDYHLRPDRVADLIDPPPGVEEAEGCAALLRHLLSGPCDIDKLEYVARDAQACGLSCGASCDPSALLQELCPYQRDVRSAPRLVFSSAAVPLLRVWIHMRHWLYLHVYWHPINRAASAMLTRAVQDALEAETLTVAHLQLTDDAGLLALLSAPDAPPGTRALTRLLAADHLYRPALEISSQAPALFEPLRALTQDAGRRKWVEHHLAGQLTQQFHTDIAGHDILLDLVRPKHWDLAGQILFQPAPVGMAACLPWSDVLGFSSRDLTRAAQHACHARVLLAPHLTALFQGYGEQMWVPLLEQTLSQMRY